MRVRIHLPANPSPKELEETFAEIAEAAPRLLKQRNLEQQKVRFATAFPQLADFKRELEIAAAWKQRRNQK